MFHRQKDGEAHAERSRFGRREWVKVTGHVVDIRLLHTGRPAPHPKIFDVRLHPTGGEPRAAVNKAKASMDLEPACGYCHQPLPAQPRARF
jgi:hypothetical protein